MDYKIPKSASGIEKKLKELKNPKTKDEMRYMFQLQRAAIKMAIEPFKQSANVPFIAQLIEKYEALDKRWEARMIQLEEMDEQHVYNVLNNINK